MRTYWKTHQSRLINYSYFLIGCLLIFMSVKGAQSSGDFVGYVYVGEEVLNGRYIYSDMRVTWPPLFALFSAPIALGERLLGPFGVRFVWLLLCLVSLYYVTKITVRILFNQNFSIQAKDGIAPHNLLIFIPFLLMMKFTLDNISNVQINVFILLASLYSIQLFKEKKEMWSALLLALTISLKVYTIFFLLYFIFKREHSYVLKTILAILFLNALCFVVWGWDLTFEFYRKWIEMVGYTDIPNHKNQSVFGMFYRYFTFEDPSHNLTMEIFNWPAEFVHKLTYFFVVLVATYPMYLLRNKIQNRNGLKATLEYSLIFTVIPLLSIMSWKAYFIFLWMPMFLVYHILYHSENNLEEKALQRLKIAYVVACILLIVSSEIFTGKRLSDYLEAYSVITIGTSMIAGILIYLNVNSNKISWRGPNSMNKL